MRKFRFTAILLLFIAAAAGSFTIPRRDLRATAQVAGLALDAKAGMLQATFELYSPESDETIGTRKEVVVTEGATLEECIDNARLVYGKTLFASDAAALIIGKNSRELLLSAVLDITGCSHTIRWISRFSSRKERQARFCRGRARLFLPILHKAERH